MLELSLHIQSDLQIPIPSHLSHIYNVLLFVVGQYPRRSTKHGIKVYLQKSHVGLKNKVVSTSTHNELPHNEVAIYICTAQLYKE